MINLYRSPNLSKVYTNEMDAVSGESDFKFIQLIHAAKCEISNKIHQIIPHKRHRLVIKVLI